MKIVREYISRGAGRLLAVAPGASYALFEAREAAQVAVNGPGGFTLSSRGKGVNGVLPVRELVLGSLADRFSWEREHTFSVLGKGRGGPVDACKEFTFPMGCFPAALEFETGNIASAHRSLNKLALALREGEIALGFLLLPAAETARYLTDRVASYEEIEPYFTLYDADAVIVLGFAADCYSENAPVLQKQGKKYRHIDEPPAT